ncbi:MAG: hypothetical protein AVDCRST_MAG31-1093, partial [uncultured Sphingomonas sp.]
GARPGARLLGPPARLLHQRAAAGGRARPVRPDRLFRRLEPWHGLAAHRLVGTAAGAGRERRDPAARRRTEAPPVGAAGGEGPAHPRVADRAGGPEPVQRNADGRRRTGDHHRGRAARGDPLPHAGRHGGAAAACPAGRPPHTPQPHDRHKMGLARRPPRRDHPQARL